MNSQNSTASLDPLRAPMGRKLLALRVIALCVFSTVISYFFLEWVDTVKPNVPAWFEDTLIAVLIGPVMSFVYALRKGIPDIIVHFVEDGPVKRGLLAGDQTPEKIATHFQKIGYSIAVLPLIPLVLAAVFAYFVGNY